MARIIEYGAYNLCFDPTLGKLGGGGADFFRFMKDRRYPVNRVKVILFRNSRQEGLLAGQSIPLFAGRKLNPRFLVNLQNLVRRGQESRISVQLCLFSYHSVVGGEEPENPPAILDTKEWPGTACSKLRRFFSLDDAEVVAAQRKLVHDMITHLRQTVGLTGVVFEIANELRSDVCRKEDGSPAVEQNRQGNCQMVRWLNTMQAAIREAAAPTAARVTTSTGTHDERIIPRRIGEANEGIVFDKLRRTGSCMDPKSFVPSFFDLHAGQWEPIGIDWEANRRAYLAALPASVGEVRQRLQSYGFANPVVVLNDDGLGERKRNTLLEHYVRAAFKAGYGYATKQQYPPLPFDIAALDTLKRVHREIPVTAPVLATADAEAAGLEFADADAEPAEA